MRMFQQCLSLGLHAIVLAVQRVFSLVSLLALRESESPGSSNIQQLWQHQVFHEDSSWFTRSIPKSEAETEAGSCCFWCLDSQSELGSKTSKVHLETLALTKGNFWTLTGKCLMSDQEPVSTLLKQVQIWFNRLNEFWCLHPVLFLTFRGTISQHI